MSAFYPLIGEKETVEGPRTQSPLGEVVLAGEAEVEEALRQAASIFPTFRQTPLYRRIEFLERAIALLEERKDQFVEWIHRESGKPLPLAEGEVARAKVTLKTTLAELWTWREEHFRLDHLPTGEGRWAIVRRVPLGPVLAITPFNFPLNLPLHKVAPALAVGAPVILKPAPQTPVTGIGLGQLFRDAGVPPAAIQVVPTTNELAEKMARDSRIAVLSFTGSAKVGWYLKGVTAARRVVLELGGNAGVIVEEDADLDWAAERIVVGAFAYSGQVCISVQRVFVHAACYEAFTERFLKRLKEADLSGLLCPLITPEAAARVRSWVQEAVARGARILMGGPEGEDAFVPATVIERVPHDLPLWREEVFGPVALLEPYEDFAQALEWVNDSRYGLQAGLFTRDVRKIWEAFDRLEVGGLVINDVPTYRADPMPYGGSKASGLLREGPRYAMEAFTEPRVLVLRP